MSRSLPPPPSLLEVLAAEFAGGVLRSEDIPHRATKLLVVGYDSPSLAIAAGLTRAETDEVAEFVRRALTELGALPMPRTKIGRVLCDKWLRDIVEGRIEPLAGARHMRMLEIDYDLALPPELLRFGYLDKDYFAEGDPYQEDIKRAARVALEEGWSGT